MNLIEKNINDILDSTGKNNNFLNDKPYSEEYKELALKWSKLPMYTDKKSIKQFFELLNDCQVILLISGTGSGKTVLVPKFFLKYIIEKKLNKKIAVTNPKILTTVYNAEYGAKTLDVNLGEEVGFKYKGAKKGSISDKTKLLYCTDGLILATILSGDNLLSEYQGIIIDEAHERHIQIDLLLKLIKEILPLRPDFKLIIMSATINTSVFRDYFNTDNIKYGEMEVSGVSNFPITQNWIDEKIKINRSNYVNIAVDYCFKILNSSKIGDIIVFVATQNDAINGCQMLKDNCSKNLKIKTMSCDQLYCVSVYSKMKQEDKELAVSKDLYKKNGFERKIIFATNVAESSITFEGLVYVIDSGFELANYYDSNDNSYIVTKTYTTQAQIKQRIGRAGRTQPGIAYHLYTHYKYGSLKMFPDPNILVVDLTDFILSLINYTKIINNMILLIRGLITVPRIEQIKHGLNKLYFIKAIKFVDQPDFKKIKSYDDVGNGALTSIGINILKFKSSSALSGLAIIMSYYLNCQEEIIILMAINDVTGNKYDSLFVYKKKELKLVKDHFSDSIVNNSDHLTVLNIYNNHYRQFNVKYLNKKIFEEINKRIKQLKKYTKIITKETYEYMNNKYKLIDKKSTSNNILYVLYQSHKFNLLKKETKNMYRSINYLENSIAEIEYLPFVQSKNNPKYIICNTLSNLFGKKSFHGLSEIPEDFL